MLYCYGQCRLPDIETPSTHDILEIADDLLTILRRRSTGSIIAIKQAVSNVNMYIKFQHQNIAAHFQHMQLSSNNML
jgi:hypothetical protein